MTRDVRSRGIARASLGGLMLILLVAMSLSCTGGCCDQCPPTPAPVTQELGLTIVFTDGQSPDPKSCRPHAAENQDHVRWNNTTSLERTVRFDPGIWPFQETQADIVIPANSKSPWYTISPTIQARQYTYHVTPALKPGPPDEPDITGGE